MIAGLITYAETSAGSFTDSGTVIVTRTEVPCGSIPVTVPTPTPRTATLLPV